MRRRHFMPFGAEITGEGVVFVRWAPDAAWSYDGILPFAPNNAYRTRDDFKRLIDAAHAQGLIVLPDAVYNHKMERVIMPGAWNAAVLVTARENEIE